MTNKIKQWVGWAAIFYLCCRSLGADISENLSSPKEVNKHMETQVLPSLSPQQRKSAETVWGKIWSQYTALNSIHGKVLDVNDKPVAKAQIKLIVVDDSDRGQTEYTTITDSRGIFEFSFKGKSAQIEIRHPDYYISKKNRCGFEFGDETDADYYMPDSHKPVIFRAYRKGQSEPLIRGKGEWDLSPNGDPFYLNLLGGIEIKAPELYSRADLIVRLFKPLKNAGGKSDWTLNLEVPGSIGGIILTKDEFMFRAPNEGYKKIISLKRDDFKGSVDGIYVYLYLCSREGGNYARLRLNLGSRDGEQIDSKTGEPERVSSMELSYFINPKGSNNLEYEDGNKIGIKFLTGNEIKLIYPDPEKLKELRKEFSRKEYRDLDDGTSSPFDFFPY